MVMNWITLATEDELSEKVGIRLANEAGFQIGQCLRKNGNGYLRSRIDNFCTLAEHTPVFLITDLDSIACPKKLINTWLRKRDKPANLLFRVAVREIEAWLLADHEAMKQLLGRRVHKLPDCPDNLTDPKRELLKLASKASREIRADLVTEKNSIASQGLGYNARLGHFAQNTWHPHRAAERSPSLAKARIRLADLAHSM
jgi:hypothetical protein